MHIHCLHSIKVVIDVATSGPRVILRGSFIDTTGGIISSNRSLIGKEDFVAIGELDQGLVTSELFQFHNVIKSGFGYFELKASNSSPQFGKSRCNPPPK
jgi:hypothetical protein